MQHAFPTMLRATAAAGWLCTSAFLAGLVSCGIGTDAEIRHARAACKREQILLYSTLFPACYETVNDPLKSPGSIPTSAQECDMMALLLATWCEDAWPEGQKIYLPDTLDSL